MLFGGGKSGNGGEGGVGATGGGHSSPSAPGRGAVETVEERAELSLNESELSALRSGGTLQRASLEEPPRAAGKDSNGVGEGHLNQHRRKLSLVGDENSPQFEEMDPSERYGRFGEELGRGACKVVYKAFDTQEGREVAWNKVDLGTGRGGLGDDSVASEEQDRILAEIRVLKALKHKNIMSFYKWWYNEEKGQVNFISEMFASGTLRRYRKRHKHLGDDVLKQWGWQILSGLVYLHGHKPPIVHRDLKCDNIFINGADGVVKIGDLGLATMLHGRTAPQSVIGTPEFMAPELYEEYYDDRVDVYAFGMVMLELATMEYPYSECTNAAQIYRKVTLQVRPAGLQKVACKELADFINTCIAPLEQRPRSRQLLKHPYFASIRNSLHPSKSDLFLASADHGAGPRSSSAALGRAPTSGGTTNSGGMNSGPGFEPHISRSMSASPAPYGAFNAAEEAQVPNPSVEDSIPSQLMRELVDIKADEGSIGSSGTESLTPTLSQKSAPYGLSSPMRERLPSPLGRPSGASNPGNGFHEGSELGRDVTGSGSGNVTPATGQKRRKGISCRCAATNRCFEFAGKYREDMGKRLLSLRLKILEPDGSSRTIEFEFDMTSDTAMSVASEMVGVLELSPEDAVAISEAMEAEISQLVSSLEGQASSDLAQAVGEFQHELSSALQYASSVDVPSGGTVSLSRGASVEPPPPRVQQRTSSGMDSIPRLESMASMHSCDSHRSHASNHSDLSTPCRSANRSPLYGSAEEIYGQGNTLVRQGSSDVLSKLHPNVEKSIKAHTPPGGSSRSSFDTRLSPRDGGDNPRESSSLESRSLKKLYESLQQVSDSRESLAATAKPPLPPSKSAGGMSMHSALSGHSVQSGLGDMMLAGGTGPPSGPPSVGSEKTDDAKPTSNDEKLQQAMNALKVVESRSLELLGGGMSNRGVPMKASSSKKDFQLDCAAPATNELTTAGSSHDSMDALGSARQSMEDDLSHMGQ